TVSIAEERIGILSAISLVTRLRRSTSVGSTSERAGCSRTSSKVSAASPVIEDTIFAKARPFRSFEAGFWSVNPAAERAQSSGWRVPVALWQRPAKAAGGRTLQNHLRCREVWRRELAI